VLKELRETKVWLILIERAGLIRPSKKLAPLCAENDELIAIFVRSEQTARRNAKKPA
jgi:four helix bundle protein